MSDLYVMCLANGEVFSQFFKGSRTIPLWTSSEATVRFKVHRPVLLLYRSRRVDQRLLDSRLRSLAREGCRFIFPDLDPYNADLLRGPIKSFEDVLAIAGFDLPPAGIPLQHGTLAAI